jgi:hypothetical protein
VVVTVRRNREGGERRAQTRAIHGLFQSGFYTWSVL